MTRPSSPSKAGRSWDIACGVYSPRQIIKAISPLLEMVITGLGADPHNTVSSRKLLVDGLAALLSPVAKESAFPIPLMVTDASRTEMAKQSFRIGKSLIQYIEDMSNPGAMSQIRVQTPCEGYLLTDPVARLLHGPRGGGELIHLYNEWLHQIVLLRDALLPFQNYADVRLSLQSKSAIGLRDFEELRSRFLVQCLTKTVSQTALVDVAKIFTAPNLPSGGYGLQYSQGLILPAFLSGSNSLHLLRFHGAHLSETVADPRADILFDYEYTNYSTAPRSSISKPIDVVSPHEWSSGWSTRYDVKECSLIAEKRSDDCQFRYLLKLQIKFSESMTAAVDLGQIARGRRCAYQMADTQLSHDVSPTEGWSTSARVYSPLDILSQPGLVSSQEPGLFLIPAANPVLGLALLGKLYPDNVVMLGAGQRPEVAEALGKDFGPKFVLFGGDFRHELLCPSQSTNSEFIEAY